MAVFDDEGRLDSTSAAHDGRFGTAPQLIKTQQHRREVPLREGGRWPVSVILQPDPESAVSMALHQLMLEAMEFAGSDHWRTGRPGTAHLTVRALERRRDNVAADDPAIRRYAGALGRAASGCRALTFWVHGVIVTPGTIMAIATPINDQADRLSDRFAEELGTDAWLEASIGLRDIWYLNLLHFAGPIADPEGLLAWADARRDLRIGSLTVDRCRLIRWDYTTVDDRYEIYPVTLSSSLLTGEE